MFKHLIIYTFFYSCACFAQIVNPVTIDVTGDSLVRAGEVVNIEISAKMEKQWKNPVRRLIRGDTIIQLLYQCTLVNML